MGHGVPQARAKLNSGSLKRLSIIIMLTPVVQKEMETWECKGRAFLRYGRNVVLGVRQGTLAEQERDLKIWKWALRSKSKKANPKPWSLWLRTVSEPGEKFSGLGGRNRAGVSIFLPWYRKELCLQSPEENLLERTALPNVFSPW